MTRQLTSLKRQIEPWHKLKAESEELLGLLDLSIEEADDSIEPELRAQVDGLAAKLEDMEFQLTMTGEYADRNAILAVHAGAGGTESQDWAEMLLRMYLRWAERHRYKANLLDVSQGEEAGIKSAVLEVTGDYAYSYLKGEHGVHRLVRLSPFDADHARHTSFALVEVLPEAEDDVEVSITPDDLRIDSFRSSGPGGQHMQKTSSAVRITHLPTGLVVTCQSERSQHMNKEAALKILHARLLVMEQAKKAEEQARLKGEAVAASWGNQIRSYVLHPYKKVKDHRTEVETSDAAGVLDGDLDQFIKAYLQSTVGVS